MKLIISGGRDHHLTEEDLDWLDTLPGVTQVLSGGAPGVDACGEAWAEARGLPVIVYPADWEHHGKAAGPIRNRLMAREADAVALFPGGRGTANMRAEAEKAGLLIFERGEEDRA